jgi:hypothetical protein
VLVSTERRAGAGRDAAAAGPALAPSPPGGGLYLEWTETPDADGDGAPDLALLLVDTGIAEAPAQALLLSGRDGALLDRRDLGHLLRAPSALAPAPEARAPVTAPR